MRTPMTADAIFAAPEKYYRVDDILLSAGVDEWGNSLGPGRVHLTLASFDVLSKTPKGVWLSVYGKKRFVLESARKRFACPSVELAVQSFKARKKRQAEILRGRLRNVERAIDLVDECVANQWKGVLDAA